MARRKTSKYSNQGQEYFWVAPRTNGQRLFVESMDENIVTLVKGLPGTGKTLFALQTGLKLHKMGQIDKIYYVRNECFNSYGSKPIGALPGEKNEKLMHMLAPIVDNIYEICSKSKADSLIRQEKIEVLPFDWLRGRSLTNCFVICDEIQNVPPIGILTVLTRIGRNTKMVLIGDSNQKDSTSKLQDGLSDAWHKLNGLKDIGLVELGLQDVQRNGIIVDIMKRYGYAA